MQYTKLGIKPDIFRTNGNVITVATGLVSDVVFTLDNMRFHLHKYPLLAKCGRLQGLAADTNREIEIPDIPGGAEAFELCAKFCYGIAITLSAYNIMGVRCAAEYLGMTEVMEKGNLGFKLEVFLNSSMFRSWRDSIVCLQATKVLLPWAEELKMVHRGIESVVSKACLEPTQVDWAFTHTRASPSDMQPHLDWVCPPWNGIQSGCNQTVPKDWWVEDICELDVDLFGRVMSGIKSKRKISSKIIGEALRVFACKWLPGVLKDQNLVETVCGGGAGGGYDFVQSVSKNYLVLETIVSLLPLERGSCSCSFLLKLLKAATILGASPSCKMELAQRVGLQLEEASLNDLLIPSLSYTSDTLYDVDLVHCILEHFVMQDHSLTLSPSNGRSQRSYGNRKAHSAGHLELLDRQRLTSAMHSSKLKVANLIDRYLAEIARDSNLPLSKFVAISELIPDFARPVYDGLYKAIDVYLKEHPGLTKPERKRICSLMDCRKLSTEACMHAAQNERLPLRMVVQVLFFEQVRTAMAGGFLTNDLPSNIKAISSQQESDCERAISIHRGEEDWEAVQNDCSALKDDIAIMMKSIAEVERARSSVHSQMVKHAKPRHFLFHPKKIFSKLWSTMNQATGRAPGPTGSSGSTGHEMPFKQFVPRRRRHSLS